MPPYAVRLRCLHGGDGPQDQEETGLTITVASTGDSTCILDSDRGVFHNFKISVDRRPGSPAPAPPSFRLCVALDSEGPATRLATASGRREERELLAFTQETACIYVESYEQHAVLLKTTTGPIHLLSGRAGAIVSTKGQSPPLSLNESAYG